MFGCVCIVRAEASPFTSLLLQAVGRYVESAPSKEEKKNGKGHDWGPARHTVAVAMLQWFQGLCARGDCEVETELPPVNQMISTTSWRRLGTPRRCRRSSR